MIGPQSRAKKSTVRGDILLVTLATREEEKRRTAAERRATAKARDPVNTNEKEVAPVGTTELLPVNRTSLPEDWLHNLDVPGSTAVAEATSNQGETLLATPETHMDQSGESKLEAETSPKASEEFSAAPETLSDEREGARDDREGVSGESENSNGGFYATSSPPMVQETLTVGAVVLVVEKQGRDYLLDPIPKFADCLPHLQECFPVIMGMTPLTDLAKVSKTRRAKEVRFLKLSGGFVLRPPAALLKRVLELHGVDVRELDQVVQHCLIVTPDNLYHIKIWLDRLSRWMRSVLKGDTEGKAWLGRAVMKLRKQKQRQMREKKPKQNKIGKANV